MKNTSAIRNVLFCLFLTNFLLGCNAEPQEEESIDQLAEFIDNDLLDPEFNATMLTDAQFSETEINDTPVQLTVSAQQPPIFAQDEAASPVGNGNLEAPAITTPATTTPATTTPVTTTPATTTDTNTFATDPSMDERETSNSSGSGRSALGTNLLNLVDYSQTVPFVDLMRTARPFPLQTWADVANVEYDEHGWPIRLNGGEAVTIANMSSPEQREYIGDYIVLYEGEGKIKYRTDAKLKSSTPGRDVVTFTPTVGGGMLVAIVELNEKNPIRNIKIMMPGGICEGNIYVRVTDSSSCGDSKYLSFADNHEQIRFNPDFLSYVRGFSSLRFMDWMGTNGSHHETWADNKQVTDATWSAYGISNRQEYGGSYGAPIEILVELANLVGVDPWFTFPHLADDDYIRRFASYVKENLSPNLKPYIEYSNEVWNGHFLQFQYAVEQGEKLGLDENRFAAGAKFYSQRSVEIFKIWENVYAGTERFTRVLAAQSVNIFMTNLILEFENAYRHADALAIAPYFNNYNANHEDIKTVDDVFASLDAEKAVWAEQVKEQAELASGYSLDLIAYEGGQHLVNSNDERLTNLYIAANRDPRMGELHRWHMDEWKKSGGKHFAVFTSPGQYSKHGSWGLKEYLTQPRSQAPKYDALLKWDKENPKWW